MELGKHLGPHWLRGIKTLTIGQGFGAALASDGLRIHKDLSLSLPLSSLQPSRRRMCDHFVDVALTTSAANVLSFPQHTWTSPSKTLHHSASVKAR